MPKKKKIKNTHRDLHGYLYLTRHATSYALPLPRSSLFEKKPAYAGAKCFNNLLEKIKKENPRNLERSLTEWLLEHSSYSVEEFSAWNKP